MSGNLHETPDWMVDLQQSAENVKAVLEGMSKSCSEALSLLKHRSDPTKEVLKVLEGIALLKRIMEME